MRTATATLSSSGWVVMMLCNHCYEPAGQKEPWHPTTKDQRQGEFQDLAVTESNANVSICYKGGVSVYSAGLVTADPLTAALLDGGSFCSSQTFLFVRVPPVISPYLRTHSVPMTRVCPDHADPHSEAGAVLALRRCVTVQGYKK